MVSVTRTTRNVENTAESLQEELARLEVQKQALERELAAVAAHLGSVQRALGALDILMHSQAAAPPTATAAAASARRGQPAATAGPRTDSVPAEPADTERPVAGGTDADEQKKYGKVTEQIMEYFAAVGDVDVRARDVAAALGRDTDSGSINGIRSTLDRLVGASRVRRTGRGLYRAQRP
ncbi:hypothetical protein AB0H18_40260 [Streptomyces sp. NPDC020766]|uniref:hypothetical protein n=1 Tax=Streptomyces sp. NPDC020766 TaxID=3155011 RepID=UPI0033D84D2E